MSNNEPEKMELASMNLAKEKREGLKHLFPEVFSEDKIDFDQLKRALGEWVEPNKERFGLHWPGKAECLKIIQQPSIATLKPIRPESVHFDTTENLFIEGDNLEVLKLLQTAYFGKIKMIYIDPPYNTGKEFIYPDKYSETLETYLKYTGQKDGNGNHFSTNTDASGRYHSRWLNMMYPRLYLARNLLREDGVIFISIDDHEQANLKTLCDQIFGEENFVANVVWNSTKSVTNTALISNSHTYNLVYMQDKNFYIKNRNEFRLAETGEGFDNPDNDPRGAWKADPFQVGGWRPNQQYEIVNPKTGKIYTPNEGCSWKNDFKKFQKLIIDGRIVFGVYGDAGPQRKRFLREATERGKVSNTLWNDIGTTTNGTMEVKKLLGGHFFDNPKPTDLIKKMTELCTKDKDIVLDFFAGSGTTAHAVMELNKDDGGKRKFICVQLPEPCDEKTEAFKAGYKTIADIGKERIRRAAQQIKEQQNSQLDLNGGSHLDLGFKVFKLDSSNFKVWDGNVENADNLEKQLEMHIDPVESNSTTEGILYEILLKAGFPLTIAVEPIQLAGKQVFSIEKGTLLICLEQQITLELIDALATAKPSQVICLDKGFQGNDQLKVNAVQTFKLQAQSQASEIVFKTV